MHIKKTSNRGPVDKDLGKQVITNSNFLQIIILFIRKGIEIHTYNAYACKYIYVYLYQHIIICVLLFLLSYLRTYTILLDSTYRLIMTTIIRNTNGLPTVIY